jgi:hypothetical protein
MEKVIKIGDKAVFHLRETDVLRIAEAGRLPHEAFIVLQGKPPPCIVL